jgi:hypothetical protein
MLLKEFTKISQKQYIINRFHNFSKHSQKYLRSIFKLNTHDFYLEYFDCVCSN